MEERKVSKWKQWKEILPHILLCKKYVREFQFFEFLGFEIKHKPTSVGMMFSNKKEILQEKRIFLVLMIMCHLQRSTLA